MERESIPGAPLNVMKSENDEEERKDDSSDPENNRRCESSARTLPSGFEPAEIVVIWIGKSVAGHKTSKKNPSVPVTRATAKSVGPRTCEIKVASPLSRMCTTALTA